MAHHLLGHASHQRSHEARPTVGAHDDHVHVLGVGKPEDLLRRLSAHQPVFEVDACRAGLDRGRKPTAPNDPEGPEELPRGVVATISARLRVSL